MYAVIGWNAAIREYYDFAKWSVRLHGLDGVAKGEYKSPPKPFWKCERNRPTVSPAGIIIGRKRTLFIGTREEQTTPCICRLDNRASGRLPAHYFIVPAAHLDLPFIQWTQFHLSRNSSAQATKLEQKWASFLGTQHRDLPFYKLLKGEWIGDPHVLYLFAVAL